MKRVLTLMVFVFLAAVAAGCGKGSSGGGPVTPEEPAVWSDVSAGSEHVVALKTDGSLWSWGTNERGESGLGVDVTFSNVPVGLLGTDTWTRVWAGDMHTLALNADGSYWAWGENFDGQLIRVTGLDNRTYKPLHIPSTTSWSTVSTGIQHTLVMYDNHTIWFYGIRRVLSSYQYERYRSPTPRQMGSNKDWAAMEAGGYHDMALKAGGTLWVWGDNLYYQLGNAVSVYETNPIQVGTDTDWSEIFSAGVYHCTALKTDGSLWAWGNNTVGQLGDGTAVNKPEPVHILPGSTWKSVSAGMVHTLGIQTDGTLWAWGSNSNGQIGNGSLDDVLEPSRIGTDTDWVKVSAGWGFSAAIKADGSLWTWGNNRVGQLGIGSSDVWSFSPVPVPAQ